VVLLLPVDESREEWEFYCALPSTKNIASLQDGQQTKKKSMNSLTFQNQRKREFFMSFPANFSLVPSAFCIS